MEAGPYRAQESANESTGALDENDSRDEESAYRLQKVDYDVEVRASELLALDYQTTVGFIQTMTDIRFKLLALVPTVSGLGVVVADNVSLRDAVGVGFVGFFATIGLLIYDLRNSQLYDAAMHRAKQLEKLMLFGRSNIGASLTGVDKNRVETVGGLFSERPTLLRLSGILVKHDRGLALVYAAALGGWAYILASTVILASGLRCGWLALVVAAAVATMMWLLIRVFDRRGDNKNKDDESREFSSPWLVSVLVRPASVQGKNRNEKRQVKRQALFESNRPARAFQPPRPKEQSGAAREANQ